MSLMHTAGCDPVRDPGGNAGESSCRAADFEWLIDELRETPRHLWDQLLLSFCMDLMEKELGGARAPSEAREPRIPGDDRLTNET